MDGAVPSIDGYGELARRALAHPEWPTDTQPRARSLAALFSKLDRGIESMRKLVYAFYNEGFSFSQFLKKNPEQRVNIINLLIGDVFREGVDEVYGPMAEFAEIPPPLWEQIVSQAANGNGASSEVASAPEITAEEAPVGEKDSELGGVMSATYRYYDDRAAAPES